MSDLFAGCSELMENFKVIVEKRDKSIKVDSHDVLLVPHNLEYLTASNLLIDENLIIFDVDLS